MHFILTSLVLSIVSSVSLPDGGRPIISESSIAAMKASANQFGTITPMSPNDDASKKLNFKTIVRCEVQKEPASSWSIQFQFSTKQKVERGEVMLARFFARTVSAQSESGNGLIRPLFEKNGPPHDKSLSQDVELSGEWKEYFLPFKALDNYEAGQATAGFHLGYQKQVVEIADFTVLSYGKNYDMKKLPKTVSGYKGQEPDAAWRKEAEKRIEQIRKGNLSIVVQNAQNKPISGATVEIRMKRHAFGWGSAVVAQHILRDDKDGERYREIIEKYFTRVVFENNLKWGNWENARNREETLKAAQWLRDRNIEIRGHCLIWPSWRHTPNDLKALANKPEELRRRIDEHIRDEATAMKGLLVDWDVINEPYDNNDVMKVLGDEEMVRWFKIAKECDPNVNLYLNDYAILSASGMDRMHQDHFEKTLKFLRENDAPISGLGMQSHFGASATPPERMLQILDRFAKLGLNISITEHDIATDDEEFQADFTRDFLITTFSHPSVVAVLGWGFWESSHWKPNAAYYKNDWSITPAGQVWIDYVTKKWWTEEDRKTDADGSCKTRAFLGDYEIIVKHDGRSQTVKTTVSKEGTSLKITLP